MNLNAAALKLMAEKGLTLADVAEIVAANEQRADPTAAERQRRSRAKRVSRRDVTRDPPNDNTLTPEVSEANASSPQPWACPAGVDPQHWADFRKNRKTKRLTDSATAYQGQLDAIAKFADDEWPPGRLVQHAAAKGWGGIYDPRKPLTGAQNGQQSTPGIGRTEQAAIAALASITNASFPD